MRAWIWFTGLIIAKAIRPVFDFDLPILIAMIGLGGIGIIMDMMEFRKRVS